MNEIDDSRAAFRIPVGRNHTDGLVDHVVSLPVTGLEFTIDSNFLLQHIDPGTQLGDHFPIYFNTTFLDQRLAGSTTTYAGTCQYFL